MPSFKIDFGVLCLGALRYLYSGFVLSLLCGRAILDGYFKHPVGREYWEEVERTRDRIWDLSKAPCPSFRHDFFTSQITGLKIHYITNDQSIATPTKAKTLILFIHGWPDTAVLWSRVFESLPPADAAKCRLVAFDQPGFGASDSFPVYDLDLLFNSITDFILAMREQHLDDSDSNHVIICGHDWGAGIAFRLAAEAPQLADRFVVSNAAIKSHAVDNIVRRIKTTRQLLKRYTAAPTNFKLLGTAFATIRPVLEQARMSSYAFIYNLRQPIPKTWLYLGHFWFPRFAACLAAGARQIDYLVPAAPPEISGMAGARHLASPMGPNIKSLSTKTAKGEGYPQSVHKRAQSAHAPWQENIRIYSSGWGAHKWSKSVEILGALHGLEVARSGRKKSSSGAGLIDDGPDGALKAPTTVLWGAGDPALQYSICVEGIRDWFMESNSQVAILSDIGHWTPSDNDGPLYWAKILSWSINGEKGLFDLGAGGKIIVTK